MKKITVKVVDAICLGGSILVMSILIGILIAPECRAQTYQGGHPPSNYGGQYWGLPDTVGQHVDQEIMIGTQNMEADMRSQPMVMSYEEYQYQKDIELCQAGVLALFPFTLGLSLLYDCR